MNLKVARRVCNVCSPVHLDGACHSDQFLAGASNRNERSLCTLFLLIATKIVLLAFSFRNRDCIVHLRARGKSNLTPHDGAVAFGITAAIVRKNSLRVLFSCCFCIIQSLLTAFVHHTTQNCLAEIQGTVASIDAQSALNVGNRGAAICAARVRHERKMNFVNIGPIHLDLEETLRPLDLVNDAIIFFLYLCVACVAVFHFLSSFLMQLHLNHEE